jgi:hypothetical protein
MEQIKEFGIKYNYYLVLFVLCTACFLLCSSTNHLRETFMSLRPREVPQYTVKTGNVAQSNFTEHSECQKTKMAAQYPTKFFTGEPNFWASQCTILWHVWCYQHVLNITETCTGKIQDTTALTHFPENHGMNTFQIKLAASHL